MLSDNIGQGDAFSHDSFGQTTIKGNLGLPEVSNNFCQRAMVDIGSQTDQPLPSVNQGILSSENLNNQDMMLRIRFACEQLPDNELSQIIIRILDGEDDDDEEEKEEGEEEEEEEEISYEETEEYEEREEEIRFYGRQLLPAL